MAFLRVVELSFVHLSTVTRVIFKTSKALKCKPSALVVDSMRESIHALRCDFLCLQDTQRKRECAIQLKQIGFLSFTG